MATAGTTACTNAPARLTSRSADAFAMASAIANPLTRKARPALPQARIAACRCVIARDRTLQTGEPEDAQGRGGEPDHHHDREHGARCAATNGEGSAEQPDRCQKRHERLPHAFDHAAV